MRKPIEQEVRGLQTPRERIWAAIRVMKKGFTRQTVQDRCEPMVPFTAVHDYFDALVAAGFIVKAGGGDRRAGSRSPAIRAELQYDLVKDQFDAPRLDAAGKSVTQGIATLAMWRAMKVLKAFDYKDVAAAASANGLEVKPLTAKTYVVLLARAGYFQTLKEAKPGTPARYRLAKNTGPHAPAITRRKCVFDRNTAQFAELETAQEVCDALEA